MFTINNTSLLETVEYTIKTLDDNNGVYTVNKVPSKEGFEFLGWVVSIDDTPQKSFTFGYNELGDKHYYAKWNAYTYTIVWKNHNGTILEQDENVPYGTTPEYNGSTPIKVGDSQFSYVWTGWTPALENVTEDTEYTATFREDINTYTVIWKNEDGTVLETDTNVPYGTTPEYNGEIPTKAKDMQYSYTFKEWTPVIETVTMDATYIATYTTSWDPSYTIEFNSNEGTEVESIVGSAGTSIEEINYIPTRNGHVFDGWYRDNNTFNQHFKLTTMPAENITLYAKWIELPVANNYLLNVNEAFNNETIYDYLNGLGYIEGKYTIYYNGTQKSKDATISSADAIAYSITVTAFTNASESTAMLSSYDIGFVVVVPKASSDYNIDVDKSNNAITVDLLIPKNSSAALLTSLGNYVNTSNYTTKSNETSIATIDSGLTKRSFGIFDSGTQLWSYSKDLLGSLLPGNDQTDGEIADETILWENHNAANTYTIQFVGKVNTSATFSISLSIKQDADAIQTSKNSITSFMQSIPGEGAFRFYVDKDDGSKGYHTINIEIHKTKTLFGTRYPTLTLAVPGSGIKSLIIGPSNSPMEALFVEGYNNYVVGSTITSNEIQLYYNNKKMSSITDTGEALAVSSDLIGMVKKLTGISVSAISSVDKLHGGKGYAQYNCIDQSTGIRFKSDVYLYNFYKA